MLKLGTAAAWFTALASAEMLPLEDDPVLPDDELPDDDEDVPGAELDADEPELLDEHAASAIAAAVIANADAVRRTRGVRDARRAPPPGLKPCL